MAEEDSEQKSLEFPREKGQYVLVAATNTSDAATMYKGKHVDPTTGREVPVAIKIFNLHKIADNNSFTAELDAAVRYNHENLIKIHCYFTIHDQLWVITPPQPGYSVRSMIRSTFKNGFPEKTVAVILKETLKALHYLHGKNKRHVNIEAGFIFLDEKSRVKLADSLTYEDQNLNVLPKWAIAPETMIGYKSEATDIWMFGLLALELLYGRVPFDSDFDELVSTKKKNHERRKKMREAMEEVVGACLRRDPERRPTTNQLMEYKLFEECFPWHRRVKSVLKKAIVCSSGY